jgi:hypothetical protein
MADTTSPMVWPAWSTRASPAPPLHAADQRLDLLAAAAERPARLRTSEATTAKPRPCSPARAASTAAKRQDIGLEGNAVDHADDVADAL